MVEKNTFKWLKCVLVIYLGTKSIIFGTPKMKKYIMRIIIFAINGRKHQKSESDKGWGESLIIIIV